MPITPLSTVDFSSKLKKDSPINNALWNSAEWINNKMLVPVTGYFGSNQEGNDLTRSEDFEKTWQDNIAKSLDNVLNGYLTSAIDAEREAYEEHRAWSEQQADLAWQRSQTSAQQQMQFQADQADLAWQRSQESANAQMAFQREMMKDQMDYNTNMANTAYQRAVSDLRKAGLNPILAYSQGSASSPTASLPSGASSSAHAMSGASASAPVAQSNAYNAIGAIKEQKDVGLGSAIAALLSSSGKLVKTLLP